MTQIRVLRSGDEAALEAFLLPRIETSMFLLGNMRAAGLEDHGEHLQGTYVAAFDGDRIVGVVAHYWNDNLILQAPVHSDALCRAALEASRRKLLGLLGPAAQVQSVKEAFDLSEDRMQMDQTENLYSLSLTDLIVPEGLRSGRLTGRRIQLGDVEQVTEWLVAFSLEALAEEEGPELWKLVRSGVQRKQVQGLTWILHDRGKPVSTSGLTRGPPR